MKTLLFKLGKKMTARTAIKRKKPSAPLLYILKDIAPDKVKGKVLDFGCGHGKDLEFLKSKFTRVSGYDPNWAPERPKGKFDYIFCTYVLNVINAQERFITLAHLLTLLKDEGTCFVTVRRDPLTTPTQYDVTRKEMLSNRWCEVTSYYKNSWYEIYKIRH